jgi:hypothetical protein
LGGDVATPSQSNLSAFFHPYTNLLLYIYTPKTPKNQENNQNKQKIRQNSGGWRIVIRAV